ncbi:MAG: CocE/NonD family hydrolase [Chitinophagaceae bacterium]
MKKIAAALLFIAFFTLAACSQTDSIRYKRTTAMIPMRDGVKLFTTIYMPVNAGGPVPIMIERTPYGADRNTPPDSATTLSGGHFPTAMANDGYIFVLQDIRGKYKSEGSMQIHQPLLHQKNTVDEGTDTYDAIDWLLKNVPGNTGKVGLFGVSYPGWLALVGSVNPHAALKASMEEACMADLFLGDDFHHNGAFRLSYGMEYSYELEHDHTTDSDFPFPQYDLFNWYLQLGSLKNVNAKYFKGKIPSWNSFVDHPNYDAYWQKNSPLNYVGEAQVPMMHVGGYYDQEDMNGPQLMYQHMEATDKANHNFIVLGPWNHGLWRRDSVASLGDINFGNNTADYFHQLQKRWFGYWLKGQGDGHFDEASCYETGTDQWKTFTQWPPKPITVANLYAGNNGTASFKKPTADKGAVSFISDPAKPVPYRTLPIEATYGYGSRWKPWLVGDQRFVANRPDVVSFTTDSLISNLTVTGAITAHLFASTTGTDADWIVKLIDVYPDKDGKSLSMSGYQLPVAMEVLRGRFRKSFANPSPLTPNKPEEFVIDLHQINHTFLKGHRLMIQVQSSWFPVIDRNPQTYLPNIFLADEKDFKKEEHTVYFSNEYPTRIELPLGGK